MFMILAAVHLTLLSTAVLADRCNLNNGMTDEVRDMFLKKHNDYRSKVARGLAKDGLGGFAPMAAKMYKMSTSEWFSELAINGVGKENELSPEVYNRGVKHYIQMVWQTTRKLGCGVKECDNFLLVGCQYHKRGNIVGNVIYKVGEPCSKCKCPKCTCEVESGLCVVQ
ncbi:hypothetical protein V3C99_014598 [Haemonchus contortus]|uniref:SCP domain-containing protein n=1 Tax=Haemonchus contortus TaxID=6289 RepID=A0A7I4YUQ8_HAECO